MRSLPRAVAVGGLPGGWRLAGPAKARREARRAPAPSSEAVRPIRNSTIARSGGRRSGAAVRHRRPLAADRRRPRAWPPRCGDHRVACHSRSETSRDGHRHHLPTFGKADSSDHDAFDFVDGHRVSRPIVQLRRLGRCVPGDLLSVLEVPPFERYAVIPVARNVWQHVDSGSPAAAARRLIMASTTRLVNGRPVSLSPARSTLWKSAAAFGSSSSAPKVCMRVAARAVETPKSRSMSRRGEEGSGRGVRAG